MIFRDDRVEVLADPKKVREICEEIDKALMASKVRVVDALAALMHLVVTRCLDADLNKGLILGYISNIWEAFDPENYEE